MVDRVERLYPDVPLWAAEPFAYAYFMAGRYEAAVEMIDRLTPDNYTLALWAMHPRRWRPRGDARRPGTGWRRRSRRGPISASRRWRTRPATATAERRRFVETMRLAGFPPCAGPEGLANAEAPLRLPECGARAEAAP